jgi:hypothetical protein
LAYLIFADFVEMGSACGCRIAVRAFVTTSVSQKRLAVACGEQQLGVRAIGADLLGL